MPTLASVPTAKLGRPAPHRKPAAAAGAVIAAILLALIVCIAASVVPPRTVAAQTAEPIPSAQEPVLAERRTAAGYLRTGNGDLAALALERLAKALRGSPDAALAAGAVAAIDAGDLPRAAKLVEQLGDRLAAERRRAGMRVFTDCVREASAIYQTLDAFRTSAPDLAVVASRTAVANAAQASRAAYAKCDAEAPTPIKADPDFRRLIDGARASLARVPAAAAAGDQELLHRLLIELRSFEQLLLFRYG
ncbi:MAG: hypothetical protein R3D62_09175 [Xanthobacteraceae bacterium]